MRDLIPEELAAIAGGNAIVHPLEGWPLGHEPPPDFSREMGDPVPEPWPVAAR